MLGNDTWFMYEQARIENVNADGYGSLNADGENSTNIDEIRKRCTAEADCKKKKNGKPKFPIICQGKINRCMKRQTKLTTQLAEAKQGSAIGDTLKADVTEQNVKTASSAAEVSGGDNTMTYIAIGGGALLLVGALAFFMLRKKAVAPATV